jgi:phenylalanyl-tRNA synthetase beta chain
MICAEDEIGLGESHAGIIILPETAVVGTLAKTYYNIPETDYAIHIGLTPNRTDAMSHIGVARDVCAYLTHHKGKAYTVKLPAIELPAKGAETVNFKVSIEAPAACARYTGIALSGVQVGPSPQWLQARLHTIGIRSINNIVDITNFVLHEFGQPLHAFDANTIADKHIKVAFMPAGTPFVTLDEKERKLGAADLMICDATGPIAIAGVFGGLHSGINPTTNSVILESAYFDATHIRRTSLAHGLRTDAATHFEKGVDMQHVITALKRAAALICELAGARVASEIVDAYPRLIMPVSVAVSYEQIKDLSGKTYSNDAVKNLLTAAGFIIEHENEQGLQLIVPTNKTDVKQAADIVEEIVRIDGLDNIEIPGRLNIALTKALPNDRKEREHIADLLCGMGIQEILTNSISNSKYYEDRDDLVKMLNSLSVELDCMRPRLLESGLEVIQYNCNRKQQNLMLFELGNVYAKAGDAYVETAQLGIWASGNLIPSQWNQKARKADLFFIKGIVQNILTQCGIKNVKTEYTEGVHVAEITWKYKQLHLGTASQVNTITLNKFDIKQEVFYAVLDWRNWLLAASQNKVVYTEVPKFPAVERDLAIILDRSISYKQVQEATKGNQLNALKDFDLFDVFESEKLGADKKSYALSYTFQLNDRTLTDVEIEQMMQQLIANYKTQLNAQIRE